MRIIGLKKILRIGDRHQRLESMKTERGEHMLSLSKKCKLLDVAPSTVYDMSKEHVTQRHISDIELSRLIEKIYLEYPFYGSRRICAELSRKGKNINRKHVQRLMRAMGIMGIAPGPMTSKPHPQNKTYPYLLKDVEAAYPNHVWSSDITYIPTKFGFMYLTAIVDWYSRRMLTYRLSNTMDIRFCKEAL